MKFERALTSNWENAMHGLRNPMNSWDKSDSIFGLSDHDGYVEDAMNDIVYDWVRQEEKWNRIEYSAEDRNDRITHFRSFLLKNGNIRHGDGDAFEYAYIGPKDLDLAQRMICAGESDSKFLRQIFVSVDITAPLYWWKEADTYKVSTTANSTSTMHKLASTPITIDCFETDDYVNLKLFNDEPSTLNSIWNDLLDTCEILRRKYNETKDQRYWKELIRILPESWNQRRTWTANYAVLRNIYFQRRNHRLTEWRQFCDWIKTLPYSAELITFEKN